ncbi:MAG: leucine-rich repeat protein, partial [bacterium]
MKTRSSSAKEATRHTLDGRVRTACTVRLLTLMLLALPVAVQAIDYTYTINSPDTNTITITGYTGSGGDVTIPSIINSKTVISLGYAAFYNCTSLTSVTIPNSVISIGDMAFNRCTNLTNVTIGTNVISIESFTFEYCTSLTSVTIPDSVTNIGTCAFQYCTRLTSITIPDSVTSIGNQAFNSCTSLTSATIPNSVTGIGDSAFANCTNLTSVTIPDSVTSIGYGAFYKCTSLTSVTIPNNVARIRDESFDYCTSLTNVTIGTNVTSIGHFTFANCTNLTSVTIPNSVTNIGNSAFQYCTSLTSVTIGTNVTSIGLRAFYGCTSLTSVFFHGNAPGIGTEVFLGDASATIYRLSGATGWPTVPGLWAGRPTAQWGGSEPKIIGVSGSLAFGNVTTGTTATALMTITNSGNTALTVTNITYPACFSGAWAGTVAAGNATKVTVTFAPVAITNYSGTVTVNSDKTGGTNTISASGWGFNTVNPSGHIFGPLITDWSSVSNLPAERGYLAAASVNGRIYAVGGFDGGYQSTVYVYDPSQPTRGWLSVSNLPAVRNSLAAASVNGKIYAVGGHDGSTAQSTVYVYDPVQPTQGWLSVSNLPAVRRGLAAASVNGRIYAIGGHDASAAQSTVYVYDPSQPTRGWLSVSNLPAVRSWLAAASVNDKIYAIGGYDGIGYQSTVYEESFATGVSPSSGPLAGGNTVAVRGSNLGNGDVTAVTLCGIPAAILADNSPTQIVVSAGSAAGAVNGDAVVYSTSCEVTVKGNAYTYLPPEPIALAATHATLNSFVANWGSVAGATNYLLDVSTGSNFTSFVAGYNSLSAGDVTTYGVHGLNAGATYYCRVRSQQNGIIGDYSSTVSVQTLSGAMSVSNGPSAGGNMITITGTGLGNGSDITNVLVGGVTAAITGQGANWVTIIVPATGSAGVKDIVIQSAAVGDTTLAAAYTVNPAGQIGGVVEDWTQWQEVAGLPDARNGLAAGVLNGALYAVGGADGSNAKTNVYRYNGTNWTEVAGLPAVRSSLAAGVMNGALYAIGGYNGGAVTNVYRYNGTNWAEVAGLPFARYVLAAGVLDAKLYAVGGWGVGANDARNNVYRYNGTNWTEVTALPVFSLYGHTAEALNGGLYAIGGIENQGASRTTSVRRYDGTNWTVKTGLPAPRSNMAAGVLNGAMYAIGGIDSAGNSNTNVYRYDGTNWTEVAGLPAPRASLAAGVLNGILYAVGGSDDINAKTNVYRYPSVAGSPGVVPASGSYIGGYAVVISGSNLGNGSDITEVTLCGVSVASIVSQSATQVVAMAAAGASGLGDVVAHSTSYGTTTKSNAFAYTYTAAITVVGGPHGTVTPSGVMEVVYGGSTSFMVKADAYYHIGSLLSNGVNVGAAANRRAYTSVWVNVTATGTLAAAFAENLTTNTGTPEWWLAQYGWTNN